MPGTFIVKSCQSKDETQISLWTGLGWIGLILQRALWVRGLMRQLPRAPALSSAAADVRTGWEQVCQRELCSSAHSPPVCTLYSLSVCTNATSPRTVHSLPHSSGSSLAAAPGGLPPTSPPPHARVPLLYRALPTDATLINFSCF